MITIPKKLRNNFKLLYNFLIYRVIPVKLNQDYYYYTNKASKMVGLAQMPIELVPESVRDFPSFVRMYMIAFVRERDRRLSLEFRTYHQFLKTLHTKEYYSLDKGHPLYRINSICDIEIDRFKKITFDFKKLLKKNHMTKLYGKGSSFYKNKRKRKINLNEYSFLKEHKFYESYIEYYKNLYLKYEKYDYEKVLMDSWEAIENDDNTKFIKDRKLRGFDVRYRTLLKEFNLLKMKQEKKKLSKFIRFKRYYQVLLRLIVYGQYSKNIIPATNLENTLCVRANYIYDNNFAYEADTIQLQNERFDDGYSFRILKGSYNSKNFFNKIYNFPTKHINFYKNKIKIIKNLRNFSYINLNNRINLYYLDINLLNNSYSTEDLIKKISNKKEFINLYKFNSDYYREIVKINKFFNMNKDNLFNSITNKLNTNFVHTYIIPSDYDLQEINKISLEEKLSLLMQLKFFKKIKVNLRLFSTNTGYYTRLKSHETFLRELVKFSKYNESVQFFFTKKNFSLSLIKYVSMLNSIYNKRFFVKSFIERSIINKNLYQKKLFYKVIVFFKENLNLNINPLIDAIKRNFMNIKLLIFFCIKKFIHTFKKVIYNIILFIPIFLGFIIKSLFYILISLLQLLFPFSYILIDIFTVIIKKLIKSNWVKNDMISFIDDTVLFVRSFKNQLEYMYQDTTLLNFNLYKSSNLYSLLYGKVDLNTIRDFFSLEKIIMKSSLIELFQEKSERINFKKIKEVRMYEKIFKRYSTELNNNIGVSLTNDNVQIAIELSSTKIHVGELYLPTNFPALEVVRSKIVYDNLNYAKKFVYNFSRSWLYKYIYIFISEVLKNHANLVIIKCLRIILNKINSLFFINRVEFKDDGIDFFDYIFTNDSVFALQEYLILTSNYNIAKLKFEGLTNMFKFTLRFKESFWEYFEFLTIIKSIIINFFSNSEYRIYAHKVCVTSYYSLLNLLEDIYKATIRFSKKLREFLYLHLVEYRWLSFLYRELRLIIFLLVQGYYGTPSRPFFSFAYPEQSSLFGIRTIFETYVNMLEAVINTYLLRLGLVYDIFIENNEHIVRIVLLIAWFIKIITKPINLISLLSWFFFFKFVYEKILFYFFYLPLYQRIRVTDCFDFVCKSKDKIAIEFAKYVQYNHERIITFHRWFKWVHFDRPKIYFRKYMLIILNFLLIITRKVLFPEIYGFTLVILERINKLSKIIIFFSNLLNKFDDWAWNIFDFINKFLYMRISSNIVYHWQCYTLEYRGLIKLFFYTPFYIIIIFLQLFFIFINIIILLLPLIIVLFDTFIEMYYNYLVELLKISPFANRKEHFDKFYTPRFNNIYRSHRRRFSESLRFKNDMIFFVNYDRRTITWKQDYKYFIDFYSRKRDLVYKCNLNVGYKRDKQILRFIYLKNALNLNKAFIGKRYRFRITPEWFAKKYYYKPFYKEHKHYPLFSTTRFHPRLLGQYGSKFNRITTSMPLELPNRFNHYYIITNNIPISLYHYVPNYWFDREIDDMIDDDFESSSLDLFDTMEPNEERYIALAYKRDICATGYYDSMEMEEQTFWAEYTFITLYRSINNFLVKKETESIKDLLSTDRIFDFYYNEFKGGYYDTYGNEVIIENFELKYNVTDYFDWRFPNEILNVAYSNLYYYNKENRYFDRKWNNLKIKINTIYGYTDKINRKVLISNKLLNYLELKKIPNYSDPILFKEFDSLRTQLNTELSREFTKHIIDKRIAYIYKRKSELYDKKREDLIKYFEQRKSDLEKEIKEDEYLPREEINRRYDLLEKDRIKKFEALEFDPQLDFTDEEIVDIKEIIKQISINMDSELKELEIEIQEDDDELKSNLLRIRHDFRLELETKIKKIIGKITELQEDYLRLIDIKRRNNFMTSVSAIKKIYKQEEKFRSKTLKKNFKNEDILNLKEMYPLNDENISLIKNFCANMFKAEFNRNISELKSHLDMAKFQLKNLECDILLDTLVYKYENVMNDLKNLKFIKENKLFKSKEQEDNAEFLVKNLKIKIKRDKIRLARKINSIKKIKTYNFLYKDFNIWFSGYSYYHSIYISCLDNGVFTWPYGHIQAGLLEDWGNWYFRYAFYLGYESFHMPDGEYYEHEEDEDEEDEDNEETEDFDDESDGDCDPWYIDGWDMDEQIDTEDLIGWLHQCFYEDDIEKGGFKIRDKNRIYYYKETNKLYYIEFIYNLKKAAKTLLEDPNRTFKELNYYERLVIKEKLATKEGILKLTNLKGKTKEQVNLEVRRFINMSKTYISSRRTLTFRLLNKLYRQAIYQIDDFRRLDKVYIPKGFWDRERDKEKYKEFARNRKLQLDMAFKKGEIMLHRLSFIRLKNTALTHPKVHYFFDLYYNEYYLIHRINRRLQLTYPEEFLIKPFVKMLDLLLEKYPNDHELIYEDFFNLIDKVYELKLRARNRRRFYISKIEKTGDSIFILDPEEVKEEAEYVKNRKAGKFLF